MSETTQDELIRVVFRVNKYCHEPTSELVGIMGNHATLGHWNTEDAPRATFIGHSQWQLETWLPRNTTFLFKSFCLDPRTNFVFHIEDNRDRELRIDDTSLFIEVIYNHSGIETIRPMISHLTSDGKPLVLPVHSLSFPKYFPTAGDWDIDDEIDEQEYYTPEYQLSYGKAGVLVRMYRDGDTQHKNGNDDNHDH